MSFDPTLITAIVLAGGRARRMGGVDKGLIPLCGRSMIEHVLDTLAGQTGALIINANRNVDTYSA
ncbi:MAG TPA: NTP transferase domain-containing protein, partial [Arenicellales bacterium]|nr:NTP transferase domain-containing protein [Arenicellales bacterium]